MYIDKILISNFTIYRGSNTVTFSPLDGGNVSIITGDNGQGKTSFLTALVWCLYGRLIRDVDVAYRDKITASGGYGRYMLSCLNHGSSDSGETELGVSIRFRDVMVRGLPCDTMEIKRTYDTATESERIDVLIDGDASELVKIAGPELFIQDFVLPKEIARFFFFDAERMVTIAETKSIGEQRQLSRAYNEVLGIKKYVDLRDSLNGLRTRFRRESATSDERDLFASLGREIRRLSRVLGANQRKMVELESEKSELGTRSEELQGALLRAGSHLTLADFRELELTKQELLEQGKVLRSEFQDLLELAPFAIMGEMLAAVRRQADVEAAQDAASMKEWIAEVRIGDLIHELTSDADGMPPNVQDDVKSFYRERVEHLLRKYFVGTEQGTANKVAERLHEFTSGQRHSLEAVVNTLRTQYSHDLETVGRSLRVNRAALVDTSRKLTDAMATEKDAFVENLRAEKTTTDDQIALLDRQLIELSEKLGTTQQQLVSRKTESEEIAQKVSLAKQYRDKDRVAERLVGELDDFLTRMRQNKSESLASRILSSLQTLLHKKSLVGSVVVNVGDDLVDIQLRDGQGREVPKDGLSRGEQQLYAAALLKALVDESGIDFPVFVDSPLQKFDDRHSRSVVTGFYPNVSKQVVLFPLLDRELREEDYQLLMDHIDSVYIIEDAAAGASRFRSVSPPELFTVARSSSAEVAYVPVN